MISITLGWQSFFPWVNVGIDHWWVHLDSLSAAISQGLKPTRMWQCICVLVACRKHTAQCWPSLGGIRRGMRCWGARALRRRKRILRGVTFGLRRIRSHTISETTLIKRCSCAISNVGFCSLQDKCEVSAVIEGRGYDLLHAKILKLLYSNSCTSLWYCCNIEIMQCNFNTNCNIAIHVQY